MDATSVSPFVKPFGIAASVIAIIQGTVWIILSLCDILIYLEIWTPEEIGSTYGQNLSLAIFWLYFTDSNMDIYVTPLQLFIWAILYFILSVIWISISSYQLFALQGNKYDVIKKIFFTWALWTTIICICDLVLTSLLASDYNYIVEIFNLGKIHIFLNTYDILAIGIMMSLAARGFVLWIVNVAFTVIIMKLSLDYPNKIPKTGFNNSGTAIPYGQNPPGQGFHNPNYSTWDANKPDFTRSDSFVAASAPEHLPKLPPIASTNERLAKIGPNRQGPKSPTHNIPPPKLPQSYIYPTQPRVPSPDYSPPNSPLQTPLKSALKNRNQNLYGYSNNRY